MRKGVIVGSGCHDPFGPAPDGIPINVTVTVDPDAGMIEIDLTDNIDCLPAGLNESRTCAMNNCMTGVFNSIDPDIPHNAGTFRRVQVKLRENCVVGIPTLPALVLGGDDERGRAARRHDPALDRGRLARLRPGRGRLRHRARLRRRLGHRLPQGRRRLREPEVPRLAGRPGRAGHRRLGHVRQRGHERPDVPRQRRDRRAEVPDPRARDPHPAGLRGRRPPPRRARRDRRLRAEARHDDGRLRDRRALPSAARHAGRRRRGVLGALQAARRRQRGAAAADLPGGHRSPASCSATASRAAAATATRTSASPSGCATTCSPASSPSRARETSTASRSPTGRSTTRSRSTRPRRRDCEGGAR